MTSFACENTAKFCTQPIYLMKIFETASPSSYVGSCVQTANYQMYDLKNKFPAGKKTL